MFAVFVLYLLTWVTWDLNFSWKESSDGARTTVFGRLFQALTTPCEKFDLMSVRVNGFTSVRLFPRRVRCDSKV